ncbi:hypothetical protein PS2_014766 [Malus domestica]
MTILNLDRSDIQVVGLERNSFLISMARRYLGLFSGSFWRRGLIQISLENGEKGSLNPEISGTECKSLGDSRSTLAPWRYLEIFSGTF